MAIEIDALGNVTKSAAIAYGRSGLFDYAEQTERHVTASHDTFFHQTGENGWYRHGVPLSSKSWELGSALTPGGRLFTVAEVASAIATQLEVAFHETPDPGEKRLLSVTRQIYWENDLTDPLPFGSVESLALPYQSYGKAFTAFMLSGTLGGNVGGTELTDEGGYENLDADGDYWAKSGITYFLGASDFYLADKVANVFGNETLVTYDDEKLFVTQVDAVLSTTPDIKLTTVAEIDYRFLAPHKVTDPNGNYAEAHFDEVGRVTATAVGGANSEGDDLSELVEAPRSPTTIITYELDRYLSNGLLQAQRGQSLAKLSKKRLLLRGHRRWLCRDAQGYLRVSE